MALKKLTAQANPPPDVLDMSSLDLDTVAEVPDEVPLGEDQLTPADEDLLVLLESFLSLTDGRPRDDQVDNLARALDIDPTTMRELLQGIDLEDDAEDLVASLSPADMTEDDFVPPEDLFDDDPDAPLDDDDLELGPMDDLDDTDPEPETVQSVAEGDTPDSQPEAVIAPTPSGSDGDDPSGIKRVFNNDGEPNPNPHVDDVLLQNDGELDTPASQSQPKDGELVNP